MYHASMSLPRLHKWVAQHITSTVSDAKIAVMLLLMHFSCMYVCTYNYTCAWQQRRNVCMVLSVFVLTTTHVHCSKGDMCMVLSVFMLLFITCHVNVESKCVVAKTVCGVLSAIHAAVLMHHKYV